MDFVVYFRRRKKGRKNYGLELDKQKDAVARFVKRQGGRVVAEYTEVEDGQMELRPELEKAIADCAKRNASLLIGSAYRVKVNVKLLQRLRGVTFAVADDSSLSTAALPVLIDQANEWAKKQSASIRKGMQGVVCGSARKGHWTPENEHLRQKAQKKATKVSIDVRRERVMRAYAPILPLMKKWKAQEGTTYADIANWLNEDGYLTTVGMPFTPQAVHRIMKDFG